MRTLALPVIPVLFAACLADPGPVADGPPGEETAADGSTGEETGDDAVEPLHELTLAAEVASSHDLLLYADLEGERATASTELRYGLADGYPRHVTVTADLGVVTSSACGWAAGPVIWHSILEREGDAATIEVAGATLAIDLHGPGTVTALLSGELTEQECEQGDGSILTKVPLEHRLVLHVEQVDGFAIEHVQGHGECASALTLPSGAPIRSPDALAIGAEGGRFVPINAPRPVAITLRSIGALLPDADPGQLTAEPGEVSLSADTKLPVEGLRSFTVVGPEAVSAVDGALYLRRATLKDSLSEPIEDGTSYPLLHPEKLNTVELRIERVMTRSGPLCANAPSTWFEATSSTPETCEVVGGETEPSILNPFPVAAIVAAGECHAEVSLPGTAIAWSTRFSTTIEP